ncbi:CRAL-TRIO domain-containing protein [Caerostris extrusa]|uniref:CRAL-TRIO domain-containing protein n=1 Tax=Caerostris extrusa TaxID=172846 RepID=A0AAV4XT81_CAEEX|nr:CRAL-TRIO domain-containing protein [Caerostris extrusa]
MFPAGKWYPSEILFEDAKKLCFLVAQQELRNPITQMTDFYTIDDFSGTGLRHLPVCTLQNMLLLLHVSFLYVHSSPEELLNYFPAYMLPEKYGGTLKDYYDFDWYRKANEEHNNFPPGGQKNLF